MAEYPTVRATAWPTGLGPARRAARAPADVAPALLRGPRGAVPHGRWRGSSPQMGRPSVGVTTVGVTTVAAEGPLAARVGRGRHRASSPPRRGL